MENPINTSLGNNMSSGTINRTPKAGSVRPSSNYLGRAARDLGRIVAIGTAVATAGLGTTGCGALDGIVGNIGNATIGPLDKMVSANKSAKVPYIIVEAYVNRSGKVDDYDLIFPENANPGAVKAVYFILPEGITEDNIVYLYRRGEKENKPLKKGSNKLRVVLPINCNADLKRYLADIPDVYVDYETDKTKATKKGPVIFKRDN